MEALLHRNLLTFDKRMRARSRAPGGPLAVKSGELSGLSTNRMQLSTRPDVGRRVERECRS